MVVQLLVGFYVELNEENQSGLKYPSLKNLTSVSALIQFVMHRVGSLY